MSGSNQFKIVLLGEGCVGKTSLVLRYCQNTFNEKHLSTLQASFLKKRINLQGKRIDLSIWDTAGQERFHALGPIYYRDSNGAVLVYDITDEDSFHKVKNWVKELRKMLGQDICLAICGNKMDMEKNRRVDQATAERYAESVGAVHFHTSAKQDKGIGDMFLDLTRRMIKANSGSKPGVGARGGSRRGGSKRGIEIVADDGPSSTVTPGVDDKKGGCC